jgi:hypothetical protein
MGLPTSAIWSSSRRQAAVSSSPLYGPMVAAALQCRQERLQLRVISQATRRRVAPSAETPGRFPGCFA